MYEVINDTLAYESITSQALPSPCFFWSVAPRNATYLHNALWEHEQGVEIGNSLSPAFGLIRIRGESHNSYHRD